MKTIHTLQHPALHAPALLAILFVLLLAPWAGAQSYTPTDITAPGGFFRAEAINDSGQLAGGYTPSGGIELPAVWHDGVLSPLPLYPGTVSGWAQGLNNAGQFVGACSTQLSDGSLVPQACVWENGTVRMLPRITGTHQSAAWAINDAGNIVGHVYTPTTSDEGREAVIWQGNWVAKLLPPAAGAQTWARAIDNSGRVAVSWATDPIMFGDEWHSARWTPQIPNGLTGTMTTLAAYGSAYDINDAGVVCGIYGYDAVVWDGSNQMFLGSAYEGERTARGINDSGVAVGDNFDYDSYGSTALVWTSASGGQELNVLLNSSTALAAPGSLSAALAVNGPGQIIVSTDQGHYVLLTPSSEPPAPLFPAPPQVAGITAADRAVWLSWTHVSFATGYNVKRATVSGGPYVTIATAIPDPGFHDTTVVNGIRYYYVISSTNGSYESANSPEVSARPLAPPVAPTALAATLSKLGRSVQLRWTQSGSPDITRNLIYRSTNGGAWVPIAETNAGTSYLDSNPARRANCSYKVTALNANGQESPYSNTVTVRTK